MTDKVQKDKIADILLEFYEEYQGNIPNRPMIPSIYASKIIDSLQEEPVSDELEKAANEWEDKATFNPFYMVMDGHHPIDVKQDITTHADSFKAGANWQKKQMMKEGCGSCRQYLRGNWWKRICRICCKCSCLSI